MRDSPSGENFGELLSDLLYVQTSFRSSPFKPCFLAKWRFFNLFLRTSHHPKRAFQASDDANATPYTLILIHNSHTIHNNSVKLAGVHTELTRDAKFFIYDINKGRIRYDIGYAKLTNST